MVTNKRSYYRGNWKMIVKKIAIVSLTAIMAVSAASISAFAKTPRYDENGEFCGYDYSIDDIDMDKIRDIIDGKNVLGIDNSISISVDEDIDISSIKVRSVNGNISIYVDDNMIDFGNAKPFVDENERVQIPIRAVAVSIGASVLRLLTWK